MYVTTFPLLRLINWISRGHNNGIQWWWIYQFVSWLFLIRSRAVARGGCTGARAPLWPKNTWRGIHVKNLVARQQIIYPLVCTPPCKIPGYGPDQKCFRDTSNSSYSNQRCAIHVVWPAGPRGHVATGGRDKKFLWLHGSTGGRVLLDARAIRTGVTANSNTRGSGGREENLHGARVGHRFCHYPTLDRKKLSNDVAAPWIR
jgi:hypothetical protein